MKGYSSYDSTLIKVVKPSTKTGETNASEAIDLGDISNIGVRSETFELELYVPRYESTELVAGVTLTIGLEASDNADFTGAKTVVQEDYGNGVGNEGKSIRYRPALDSPRYWRAFIKTTIDGSGKLSADSAERAVILSYVC